MEARELTVYCDRKDDLPGLRARFPGGTFALIKQPSAGIRPPDRPENGVVLALRNEDLQKASAALRGAACEVYVMPGGAGEPIRIDVSKPRLDYLETEITHVCNLNCRGCCGFMNLVREEERIYRYERFCADLARLKELFWGIAKIRLMGGEPLLNPRLADYAEAARSVFPDCDLRIVTNGLLMPKLSAQTLDRIGKADCSFDISNYPPTQKKKKEIVSVLHAAGVKYNFSIPMRYFFRNLRREPAQSPEPAFNNCIFTHCHMLLEGRLSPCSFAACTYRFNRRYGTDYTEADGFDLSDPELDGWKIISAFTHPHEFCRYCGSGIIPIRWKAPVSAADARESDWVIPDTFVNTVLAPKAQTLVKNSAVRLRAKMQKK